MADRGAERRREMDKRKIRCDTCGEPAFAIVRYVENFHVERMCASCWLEFAMTIISRMQEVEPDQPIPVKPN